MDYQLGCRMALQDWVRLNRIDCFEDQNLMKYVAPLPPIKLMQNVSGLTNSQDFASHGADIFIALSEASPIPLHQFKSLLDFGCGCGRFARMLKGHPGKIRGCDIDKRHVDWIDRSLPYMQAKVSKVYPPVPYEDDEFEAIVSISIFSHLNEQNQNEFLEELRRISSPDGLLFITVHGEKALDRARTEKPILDMLAVDDRLFEDACETFSKGNHAFILQNGHLTTKNRRHSVKKVISEPFEYGITFTPASYIHSHWTQWFHVIEIRSGGIHDFQDIVVLKARKDR